MTNKKAKAPKKQPPSARAKSGSRAGKQGGQGKPVQSLRAQRLARVSAWLPGDKLLAVGHAIQQQLTADGYWPPNDGEKVMGQDYGYDNNTMGLFLNNIQDILKKDVPPYRFSFDAAFAASSLGYSVNRLTGEVDLRTQ